MPAIAGRSSGRAGTVCRLSTRKRVCRVVPTWSLRSMSGLRGVATSGSLTDRRADCNRGLFHKKIDGRDDAENFLFGRRGITILDLDDPLGRAADGADARL